MNHLIESDGSGIFIQVGAGAGDLVPRANYRDGFTELIKSLPKHRIKKIILIEPNPLNIPHLRECWKDYPEATIIEVAIIPKNIQRDKLNLYYCPDDKPHYQVASINKEHVKTHYGKDCVINTFEINTEYLESLINKYTTQEIELLSLDIEGIDDIVLLDLNFNNIHVKYISFEYLHLGNNKQKVIAHMNSNNFEYVGNGCDYNGYDWLYKKKDIQTQLYPITFSIPEEKIVDTIQHKTKFVSSLIPGDTSTYIYDNETDYYNEYKKSMFAITIKKSGWDCMRHYEILANGTIPYFPDIEKCPPNTMALLPKNLIIEGNSLYNKYKNQDKLSQEDMNDCYNLISRLLNYTRTHLTTNKMAKYILNKTGNGDVKNILYLSASISPDYLRCVTLHGFKELFGDKCHDYPKIPHIYKSNDIDYTQLYGKGITYTNLLEPELRNDELDSTIEEDIQNKKYDIVIYGSYHQGMLGYDIVSKYYNPNEIILLCGEDEHNCDYQQWLNKGHHVFVREL